MAFLANPTARSQQYVDTVTGSASGPGSAAAPWATIDQGLAGAPANVVTLSGGARPQVVLNGTVAAQQTFVSTAGIAISGTQYIKAANAGGAILAGNGTTQAILLATGADLTLEDVILDPSLNNGGAAAAAITVPSTATVISLTLDRVTFQNWTGYAVDASGGCRINYTETDCTLNGGTVTGGVFLNSLNAGAVAVTRPAMVLTSQNTASRGGYVIIGGSGNTATCQFTDPDIAVTLDSGLAGAGLHYGIRVVNIAGATVDGGTHSISGAPGSRTGACVLMDYNGADNIDGSQIINATGTNSTNGGYVFAIGLESSGTPAQAENCEISGNTAAAVGAAITGGCHLGFLGFTKDSSMTGNTFVNGGISVVDKDTVNSTVTGNTVTGFASSGIRAKGSTNGTYSGNTVTQTAGYSNGTMIDLSWDDIPATPTTGAIVSGNTFANAGGSSTTLVTLDNTGGSATPSNNIYNQSSGSLAANPWRWLGVNYSTLAAWQVIEPTATGNAP